MRRLTVLIAALALTACGGPPPPPKVALPPAERLECGTEPAIPDEPITDEKNADYLKGLRNWGLGCWSDVQWLRSFFRTLERR